MNATATEIELDVTGMTCAACASRIERSLNKLDGVTAAVNYATERASVAIAPVAEPESPDNATVSTFDVDSLISAVEALGYGATLHATPDRSGHHSDGASSSNSDTDTPAERAAAQRTHDLRQRLIITTVLGVPVLLMSMIEALQFRNW